MGSPSWPHRVISLFFNFGFTAFRLKLTTILYRKAFFLLLFIAAEKLGAQVCTGTISDPAVVIDFGNTHPRTTALPQVPVPYQFSISNCPAQGSYAVRNTVFQCFNNLWQVLPADHTLGDIDGNFLVINALPGPTTFYIDTIKGLCGGHTFRVGAWVSNVVNPFVCSGAGSTPNLTFSVYDVSGAPLGTYTTGDIVPFQPAGWTNVTFQFDLPSANTDVILKISDSSPNGCGNDFALDDITFSPCGGNMVVAFAGTAAPEIDVCEESQLNYLLTASVTGFNNPSLQWQISYTGTNFTDIPGATGATYLRTPAVIAASGTSYYYRLLLRENGSASCKFNSNTLKVELYRPPFAQGTNYVFGCYGSDVLLGAAGGSIYHWSGPNGFQSNQENPIIPSVDFGDAGTYIVKVTTQIGCYSYDTTELTIYMAPVASIAVTEYAICEGQAVQLNVNSSNSWSRYIWTPAESLSNDTIPAPVATPLKTTTYIAKVYNETVTCYDTASVKIIVWPKPVVSAGPDKFTYSQKPVVLEGNIAGAGASYVWTPSAGLNNPLFLKPLAIPLQTTTYRIIATSSFGCGSDTDEVEVKVIDSLLIPTAFTPNRDGLNDTWEIITFTKYTEAIVEVYNRWGQKVYSSTGANYQPWDGKFEGQPVSPGAYVFYLRLNKKTEIIKGILHVIL